MKKMFLLRLMLFTFLTISVAACNDEDDTFNSFVSHPTESDGASASDENGQGDDAEAISGIRILVGEQTLTATMENNTAARDFISRLPFEVTMSDYNNITEKIFYPTPQLDLSDTPRGCTPIPGDITIYEPWGNVAIFCKNGAYNNGLIKIGHIDGDGIKALAVGGSISVRFEKQ